MRARNVAMAVLLSIVIVVGLFGFFEYEQVGSLTTKLHQSGLAAQKLNQIGTIAIPGVGNFSYSKENVLLPCNRSIFSCGQITTDYNFNGFSISQEGQVSTSSGNCDEFGVAFAASNSTEQLELCQNPTSPSSVITFTGHSDPQVGIILTANETLYVLKSSQ